MIKSMGINGQFRVIDEFVCTAICHDTQSTSSLTRGENAGFQMTTGTESSSVTRDEWSREFQTQVRKLAAILKTERPLPRRKIEEILDRLDPTMRQQLLFELVEELQSDGFFNRWDSANISLDQKADTHQSE